MEKEVKCEKSLGKYREQLMVFITLSCYNAKTARKMFEMKGFVYLRV